MVKAGGQMPKVHLTKFVCKELVYDYLTGALDASRREKFQEFLNEDLELKKKLDRNKHALQYVGELKKIELSEAYQSYLSEAHDLGLVEAFVESPVVSHEEKAPQSNIWSDFWSERGELLKLIRRTTEALSLAIVVFLVVSNLPKELFDFESKDKPTLLLTDKNKVGSVESPATTHGIEDEDEVIADDINEEAEETAAQVASSEKKETPVEKPEKKQASDSSSKNLAANVASKNADSSSSAAVAKVEEKEPAKKNFYLYRSIIYVQDLIAVSDEFLTYLEANGAKKAGQVKMGWEKNRSRYFHFHIDESKREEMEAILSKYAPFRLNRYDHWRKTPEGKMRAIVEIRQKAN